MQLNKGGRRAQSQNDAIEDITKGYNKSADSGARSGEETSRYVRINEKSSMKSTKSETN